MKCDLDPTTLSHVKLGTIEPKKFKFAFGENVTFKCDAGFAYALNTTQKVAKMQCLTMPKNPYKGVWIPGPCQACIGKSGLKEYHDG